MNYIDNITKEDAKLIIYLVLSSFSFYFTGGTISLGP